MKFVLLTDYWRMESYANETTGSFDESTIIAIFALLICRILPCAWAVIASLIKSCRQFGQLQEKSSADFHPSSEWMPPFYNDIACVRKDFFVDACCNQI